SVVQLVAGLYPDVDWRDDLVTVSGFAPFDDELHPDPHWFDRADRRVRALVRAGIVPCVFGLWAYHVGFVGIDAAMRLWREIIARWSALPVIWTVAGEASLPWYGRLGSSDIDAVVQAQLEDIRRLASFVRQHDTYLNPIAAHPCPGTGFVSSLDQFEEHLDLIMLQTGHRGQWSIPVAHEALATARERRPEVPVVNAEASYEGILGSSWHSDQRWQAWSQLLGGAAGFTYGAQGLWRFDQGPNDPLRAHTGSWGEYRWQDAAQFEGGRHIGLAGCLLRQWGIEDYRPSPDVLVTDEPLPPPAAPAVVRRADGWVCSPDLAPLGAVVLV
ncbi:MAG: DUF4038 domain-containing protein, partial [Acidimicrobiales bacterium]|nr:DUF4038 domain-containing protein [Acidimicrobiales bacterium]